MSLGPWEICIPTASGWSRMRREIYKLEQCRMPRYSRVPYHQKGTRTTSFPGFQRLSAETQPRFGVTLGGVKRPTGTLVPRMRQAPDGGKEGGSQPTESSVINRRILLAPALPIDKRKNYDADVKKWLPTLDIGSHINAAPQPRLEAGAERTLEGVGCSGVFGTL